MHWICKFGHNSPMVALVLAWVLGTISFAQNVIHVPADASTIQGGINQANNGDTVLVSPGSYFENLDFKGKAITVTSGATSYSGAAATILNGVGNLPTVAFQTNETRSSVLNGFTIQNTNTTAVYLFNASASVTNNAIVQNLGCPLTVDAAGAGGLIRGNRIANNRPTMQSLRDYSCTGPYPHNAGLGFDILFAGQVEISDNLIENNLRGSGAYRTSEVSFTGNTVRNNGGAISFEFVANVTMVQNLIVNNQGPANNLSGVALEDVGNYGQAPAKYTIINNTFSGNDPAAPSAGVGDGSQFSLASQYGGSLQSALIENNIGFTSRAETAVNCLYQSPTIVTFGHNDSFDGGNLKEAAGCMSGGPAVANLNADPQFINLSGNDAHTSRTSPVVYAGDILAPLLPPTDFDGKNRTVCGQIDMGVYQTHPIPPIALTSAPNPSVGGTSVTFSAHVTGNCNLPTGSLTFFDGPTSLGTMPLDAGGNASLSTAALLVGTHSITATYPGDFNFDPSTSNVVQQIVTGYPTTTALQVVPNPAKAFQQITFTANVASQFGVPTGSVSFLSGSTVLAIAAVNGSGVATANLNTLGAGTYNITAVYNNSLYYASSTSPTVVEIVLGATSVTALSSAPNPSLYGQPVVFSATVSTPQSAGTPTGSVSFQEGSVILGTAVLSSAGQAFLNTTALAVGTHSITAIYGGSLNVNASTSGALLQVVQPAATSVMLTGTPNPAALGRTVILTAFASSSGGAGLNSGSVVFKDQFGTIGSAPLIGGQATISLSTLASGTHNIVATLAAAGNYAGAVSPPFAELIQSFDFSVTLTPATLSLAAGKQGQVTVLLSGVGNLPGNVTLQATQIPMYATLGFQPATVTFSPGGSGSSQLSIDTAQAPPHATLEVPVSHNRGSMLAFAGLLATPLLLFRRRRLIRALGSLLLITGLATMSGCTNIYYPLNRVAPGTYAIPIIATDTTSGITHTATLTLTVTP